jgi:hypothetical protein
MGVDRRIISAYHPQSDGLVERTIGIIKPHLFAMLKGVLHMWPLYLPFMQLSHNMQYHSQLNMSRFVLYFARDVNTFTDYTNDPPLSIDYNDWRKYYEKILTVIYPAIQLRALRIHDNDIARLDEIRHRSLIPSLTPGTPVTLKRVEYMKDGSRKPAYEPTYDGRVYTVSRRTPTGAYVLLDDEKHELPRRVTIDQIKVVTGYQSTEEPTNRYLAERIIDDKMINGEPHFLVKWLGWDECEATWEPKTHIESQSLISKYQREKRKHARSP